MGQSAKVAIASLRPAETWGRSAWAAAEAAPAGKAAARARATHAWSHGVPGPPRCVRAGRQKISPRQESSHEAPRRQQRSPMLDSQEVRRPDFGPVGAPLVRAAPRMFSAARLPQGDAVEHRCVPAPALAQESRWRARPQCNHLSRAAGKRPPASHLQEARPQARPQAWAPATFWKCLPWASETCCPHRCRYESPVATASQHTLAASQ
mmetsp:Transcript_55968/g.130827  ORF Transcript_55968/g.130827 Transcript_55968/m.130827 type:complete len:208 (-) Transcript_55968:417-1040(-)